MNSYSLARLWRLSAPKDYILSSKGILLAIAEQLDIAPLEINLVANLRLYGMDSMAIVSLVGLWRANGADIRYEDVWMHPSVQDLQQLLLPKF